jgi:hypothetical protein
MHNPSSRTRHRDSLEREIRSVCRSYGMASAHYRQHHFTVSALLVKIKSKFAYRTRCI